jgi:hypothetical protein
VISEEKIKAIRKLLRKGYPQGELTNDLLSEGYTSEEIQQAYYSLYPKTQTRNNSSFIPLWYAACVGIAILFMAILAVEYELIRYYKYVFPALGMFSLAAGSLADKFGKK